MAPLDIQHNATEQTLPKATCTPKSSEADHPQTYGDDMSKVDYRETIKEL